MKHAATLLLALCIASTAVWSCANGSASTDTPQQGEGGPTQMFATLAKELGISESKVQEAFQAVMPQGGPGGNGQGGPPNGGQGGPPADGQAPGQSQSSASGTQQSS